MSRMKKTDGGIHKTGDKRPSFVVIHPETPLQIVHLYYFGRSSKSYHNL